MTRDERRYGDDRGRGGIPDGLLIGLLAFLLGVTIMVWTATGLAGLFTKGAWPSHVTFGRTPLAMRSLMTQPHDIPAAWPATPKPELSGYGLFWGLFIGQLMILVVLAVFVAGTVARWRAVRRAGGYAKNSPGPDRDSAAERETRGPVERARGSGGPGTGPVERAPSSGGPGTGPVEQAPEAGPAGPEAGVAGPEAGAAEQAPGSLWADPGQAGQTPAPATPGPAYVGRTPGAAVPGTASYGQTPVPAMPGAGPHGQVTGSATPGPAEQTPTSATPGAAPYEQAPGPAHPGEAPGTGHAQPPATTTAATWAAARPDTAAPSGTHPAGTHPAGTAPAPWPEAIVPGPRSANGPLLLGSPDDRHPHAVQAIRDAEGPVLVITSAPRVWEETKDARAKLGPVLLYDPTHRCDTPARMHWNPAAGCTDRATATTRAAALLAPIRPTAKLDSALAGTAETLLRSYLHAAAVDGKPFRHVHRWAQGSQVQDAVRILRTSPKAAAGSAGELEAALTSHPERRDMAQELTARALSALSTIHVRESCTPNRTDALTLDSFVDEGGTLYVVGEPIEDPKANPGAMPLLTALASSVVEHGRRMADRSPAGRLDPPMTLVLDDVAAVAPLPQLPELLTAGPDRGLPTLALLRSREQARSRWPEAELPTP
ncbi:type VI secretion protein [Streptomyces sp. SGAir0957]